MLHLKTKRLIVWLLLTESMLILSTRMGAFIHEFIGHGLMAELFGGNFEAFTLSLFAGGHAYFSGEFSESAYLLISLGGIIVNISSGILVLWYIQKKERPPVLTLFALLLAAVSILSQLQYLILGTYYRHGDPVCLASYPKISFLTWSGGLLALACFSLYLTRLFIQLQETCFPSPNLSSRALTSLLIFGLPILIYGGLYYYSKTPLSSMAAIEVAQLRIQKEAERIKLETKSRESLEDIQKKLEPPPIWPWVIAIYFFTALMALFFGANRKKRAISPLPSSLLYPLPWLLMSGLILGLIVWLWPLS